MDTSSTQRERIRADYARLAEKARTWDQDNADYITDLAGAWDERLAALPDEPVPPGPGLHALRFLSRAIRGVSPGDPDAATDWVDAFPDAVVDLHRHWGRS